ncbi:DUF1223 domain-containing protein [Agrilutibacter solisilvae]|uniref:DUF1223 domain-containing protein n=1 Tax=Agrilutibacter solisilvae TaxID=2763317 RepID=A0A975ASU8_9GAMM|nr:DUF1223 domain-containing protein [Lysobacter solisilvae]QSX78444.1 DUF1223 domain-containing protein [Lysobacter solisilvae]
MRLRALTAALAMAWLPQASAATDACSAASGTAQLPLVELYTSEGCSDCPPADKWLSQLTQEAGGIQAAALAFHVDYWDDLGWVDRFGLPMNSQRQKARIGWAKSKALVTPAVMIGEKVMVKWRSPAAVESLLQARAEDAPVGLGLAAKLEPGAVQVDFQATPESAIAAPAYVWLALYQDGLTSAVRAGENKNVTLHHDRVVRALHGPWQLGAKPIAGDARIPLPADADVARMGLVLFAESGTNGAGLQAVQMPLSGCAK